MTYKIDTKPGQVARMITGDDAQLLADLNGIQRDLDRVAHACRVIENRKGLPSTEDVRRACFDSAVLRYRRCFKSGIRSFFPRLHLSALSQDEQELHDIILQIADKSVAHCVDGSEENLTYVLIGPAENGQVPIGVSVISSNILHHNKIDPKAFENLANKVRSIVREQADQAAADVLARLEAGGESALMALPEVNRAITEQGEALSQRYGKQVKMPKDAAQA